MDQYSCDWCKGNIELRKNLVGLDASQLHQQLRALKYDYLLFDIGTFRYLTSQGYSEEVAANITNEKFNELVSSGVFVPVKNIPGGERYFP